MAIIWETLFYIKQFNLWFLSKQRRKRPLDTPKRMIERREREGEREKERKKGRRRDIEREGEVEGIERVKYS